MRNNSGSGAAMSGLRVVAAHPEHAAASGCVNFGTHFLKASLFWRWAPVLKTEANKEGSRVRYWRVAVSVTSPNRDYVATLMSEGKIVMFVGDGTNDAVAVTQADIGVQLASILSASDVTRGAADVVLLVGLEGIPFLLDISGVSFRRMAFNFGWTAVYNVLAILLASGAMVNVRIPPAYAGLGEIVSVLPVIFAASTMLMKKIKTEA